MTDAPDSDSAPEDRSQPHHQPPFSSQRPYEPAPVFANMPGGGKGAVVLLWIMFGFGICGVLVSIVVTTGVLSLSPSQLGTIQSGHPWLLPILFLNVIQVVVWTVLRGVFAVRIPRRNKSARSGAVALELIGIVISTISWFALLNVEVVGSETGNSGEQAGSCLGLALSLIIIGLLSARDMKEWCDR